MDSQGRSRLIVGGITLAAIVLVIVLLLTQQSRRLPVDSESPLATPQVAEQASNADEEVAEGATPAQRILSPLAAPVAESPLTTSESLSSAASATSPATLSLSTTETASSAQIPEMVSMTGTVTGVAQEAAVVTAPVTITARSTVTVTLVPSQPLLYGYDVVATYPHDPSAFTQGLQYVDGVLYEGTGLYGSSSLRRVELETGRVEQQIALADEYFGEGIVVIEDRIYQLTWQSHVAFLYDRASFTLLDEFTYPTEGWGLTYDGEELIMSDGSSILFRRDPETFAEVGRIDVSEGTDAVNRLNELEYIDGLIWANIWQTDKIAMIDPSSGQVRAWVDLAGLLPDEDAAGADVLNGIAYDEEHDRIFVTGKFWPKLFEIDLVPN
jgi:glutamine cyclotransferase